MFDCQQSILYSFVTQCIYSWYKEVYGSWNTVNRNSFNIWAASWPKCTKWLCAQRRLRSAWVSAQSDQSLRCPHEESLGLYLPTECTAKTLIRLGGCPGWSKSSLGAQSFCWFSHEAAQFSLIKQCKLTMDYWTKNKTCNSFIFSLSQWIDGWYGILMSFWSSQQ